MAVGTTLGTAPDPGGDFTDAAHGSDVQSETAADDIHQRRQSGNAAVHGHPGRVGHGQSAGARRRLRHHATVAAVQRRRRTFHDAAAGAGVRLDAQAELLRTQQFAHHLRHLSALDQHSREQHVRHGRSRRGGTYRLFHAAAGSR